MITVVTINMMIIIVIIMMIIITAIMLIIVLIIITITMITRRPRRGVDVRRQGSGVQGCGV